MALSIYYGYGTLAFILAAAIHELGHIAAITLLDEVDAKIELKASGIYIIRNASSFSTKNEMIILLSGPILGFVAAALGKRFKNFSDICILLSTVNILPVRGTDGGSIAELICPGCTGKKSGWIMPTFSLVVVIILSVFALQKINALLLLALLLIYIRGMTCDDRFI